MNALSIRNKHLGAARIAVLSCFLLLLNSNYSAADECSKTVLLVGDSIGAGYGLIEPERWATLLADNLSERDLILINASVSGETSAGGLRRLPGLILRHQPRLVILELGGNDGLRGYPLSRLKENLAKMIAASQQSGATVYLLGMHVPPNYGPVYGRGFNALYQELASENDTAILPFLLEGVGRKAELMQADGIHPSAAAQGIILSNVLSQFPKLEDCTKTGSNSQQVRQTLNTNETAH